MKRCVALLDVDHTLLMDDNSLNENLTESLLCHEINHLFLFTDMTFHAPAIEDRNLLIKALEEGGFAVHGVITPNDLTWHDMDSDETLKLHDWCFIKKVYTGKLYGDAFENFIHSNACDFPKLSDTIRLYSPAKSEVGVGYSDASMEYYETKAVSDATRAKSVFAKVFSDHISERCGYNHSKGLLLDMFLRHMPNWVESIVVVDDNKSVVSDIDDFHPVQLSTSDLTASLSLPNTLPMITMVPVTSVSDRKYFDGFLERHLDICRNAKKLLAEV